MSKQILVIGKNGQLATELCGIEWPSDTEAYFCGRDRLDITKAEKLSEALSSIKPDVIINTAAYTAVDKAESDQDAAYKVNATAVGYLAKVASDINVPILQISTDYVFDGNSTKAYTESDEVRPLSVYGASKLAGEEAIRATMPDHVILRASWLFGAHGHNFLKTMLRLAASRPSLKIVDDQHGGPTPTLDLAFAVQKIALELARGRKDGFGTFHFCGAPATSWHDFAVAIFAEAKNFGITPPAISRTDSQSFSAPAARPARSVLDCSKIATVYGIEQPNWRSRLNACLRACVAQSGQEKTNEYL